MPGHDDYVDPLAALRDRPRILIEVSALDLFFICAQLQLAARHPVNSGESARRARLFADQAFGMLGRGLPALAELAELGWDPAHDVPW